MRKRNLKQIALTALLAVLANPGMALTESYFAWSEPSENSANIYLSKLLGDKWAPAQQITELGINVTPAVSVDRRGGIWIVWIEFANDDRILRYAHVQEGDKTFGEVLAGTDKQSFAPSIIVDRSDRPWLAWAIDDGNDEDIVFSRWNGTGWDSPQLVHADNQFPDITPTLGLNASGRPWVSWESFDGDSYVTKTAYWLGDHWQALESAAESEALQTIARHQRDAIPKLPTEAGNRLMGALFVRDSGEIQSMSERSFQFETGRPQ